MRILAGVCLLYACANTHYLYDFDLTDSGARNYKDSRRPDILEDGDLKAEVRVDPAEFKAVAYDLTNKTDQPIYVNWQGIFIIGPDHNQISLRSSVAPAEIEPGARVSTVLGPFTLPDIGSAARFYDESDFDFMVPMTVRGQPREAHYHLHAKLKWEKNP
jgi:hypothetical protein